MMSVNMPGRFCAIVIAILSLMSRLFKGYIFLSHSLFDLDGIGLGLLVLIVLLSLLQLS